MDKNEGRTFIGDWSFIQTLGEGAYGEVKLLMHKVSGDLVAVKIVNLKKNRDAEQTVRKEIKIQSICNHPNVIKIYGERYEAELAQVYIYLEYAAGGELFNLIEPDVGMFSKEAQKYMWHLLSGLEFLHKKGIAHRDIKPENLLLDRNRNLKISDFGLATLYLFKGKERLLDKRCGTLPYVAPEVLTRPYFAQPADIWSCGIVLVAMLAGELPWDEPTFKCKEFLNWNGDEYLMNAPWNKIENSALSLIRKMLSVDVSLRPSLEQIRRHHWMNTEFPDPDEDVMDSGADPVKRVSSMINQRTNEAPIVTCSQPAPCLPTPLPNNVNELLKNGDNMYFSQPTQNENILLSASDLTFTNSPVTKDNFKHLIKRMTRFFVKTDCEKTVGILGAALNKLHYTWNVDASGVFTASAVDNRKMQLTFKTNFIDMDGKLLLDFRLAKGCGLEFKKRFVTLKSYLSDIVIEEVSD